MNEPSEGDLAWDLLEQVRSCLTIAELNTVFVRLGVADYWSAIEIVLRAVGRTGERLPPELVAGLAAWLDVYDGQPDQPRLWNLLARCMGPDMSNEGDVDI
jgi:hypothetical protein